MKTQQLRKALKNNPITKSIFGGIYACNKLPKKVDNGKAYIANTDPSHKRGQHWVGFYFTASHVYYFDSYGQLPIKPEFYQFMKQRKIKKVFNTRLQGPGSACGHYCLYFILVMRNKLSFDLFGNDLLANDKLVQQIVCKHFHLIR